MILAMLIVIATGNQGKVKEFELIAQMANDREIEFKTIKELCPDANFDPEETGSTFAENAMIKAKAAVQLIKELDCFANACNKIYIMSDDSGIEIDAMDGRPGIYAARYLKTKGIEGVLEELGDTENRNCKFTCHITLLDTNGKLAAENESYWTGKIASQARGDNGFGYDPIVIPDEYPENTVAELSDEIKSQISHRAKAFNAAITMLE
jgi:XTP/dITP diphosphohydrolase